MTQNRLTKLELTWIGKDDEREALEPRILIEDSEYSYNSECVIRNYELKNNYELRIKHSELKTPQGFLIHGDNLLALKALEQEYAGKVKCIYIDPPYNTGNAFEHYDDGLEHSIWLGLMRERLELLHKLLSKDGSIWISIDDDESHYLKVLCDEVFGRRNFVANIVWQKKYGPANDAKWFSDSHDHILVFAKNKDIWRPNLIPRTEEQLKDYKNPDNDPRGVWRASDMSAKTLTESCVYEIEGPTGLKFLPPPTRAWIFSKSRYEELLADNRIWFGVSRTGRPMVKKFLTEVKGGITPETWWSRDVADDNKIAKYESKKIYDGNSFATPKPEKLLQRILTIATNENDIVLDSFLGSATTSAVAHKMGRRWIGVELGEHAKTHCYPRMKMVCDGTDQGGISKAQNWSGGGGFKFYTLAPSLLNEDTYGNLIINKEYNADMLAAAMAKHEGFRYSPDKECYWKQGRSSESDYIYTTTQFLTLAALNQIKEQMMDDETLVVCCKSYEQGCNHIAGISIKKIPQTLLGRCEFNTDGYPLNIIDLPCLAEEEEYYTLDEQLEDQRSMHEDLMSLEREWDRQECYECEDQGRLFE